MKVVKCLEHIPEDLWGRVVEDGFLQTRFNKFLGYDLKEFNIKQSDTFPLPEQGDKVEVSEDGVKWYDNDCVYVANYKKVFIINEPIVQFASANYIRPIEVKEERSEFRELAERLDRVYKIVYKYVNGTNPPKTDKS